MAKQLLRPDGVRGLCSAIFGEGRTVDDASLDKLEHISRLLSTVPLHMKSEVRWMNLQKPGSPRRIQEYFAVIVPKIVGLLTAAVPEAFRRAAAFSISRMLDDQRPSIHRKLMSSLLLPFIHSPFFRLTDGSDNDVYQTREENVAFSPNATPNDALSMLIILLANIDPSPRLITKLLSPVVPALYSILAEVEKIKTADPELKESLKGMLRTWGRVSSREEGVETLLSIVDGEGGNWLVGIGGDIRRVKQSVHFL